jgi:vacuolar-type H+-ATPase subunit C/Vma6
MIAAARVQGKRRSSAADYDYLNARVRGMSTQLFAPEFYDHALASLSGSLLMDSLLASPYAAEVRHELAVRGSSSVARAVESAAVRNTQAAFAKVLAMAPPEPRRLLAVLINRWDVANVLALARALLAGAGPQETRAALLPIGELSESQLLELAAERHLESLADSLTSWGHGFAFALRRALRECENPADPRALEHAVYDGYFSWALPQLKASDRPQALVRDCVRMQIDFTNVGAALAAVRDRSRGSEGEAVTRPEPIPRGMIPAAVLQELASADSLEAALESLMETYFAPGVEKGILAFGQARSLAVMERFLEEVVLERGCRLFRKDMLGMSVPVGFVWRKYCELANLRLLARGAAYHIPSNAIRQELVLV